MTTSARSPRVAQILCVIAGLLPLVAAILFTTNRALTLDPIRPVNLHPEPYGVDILASYVTSTRIELAVVGLVLIVLAILASRVGAVRAAFSRWPAIVVFALLIIALPFGIAELCARTLLHGTDEQLEPDPYTGVRWKSNASFPYGYVSIDTNDRGMRGPHFDYAKPPGTKRVLLLGGAMAVSRGLRAEDTFPGVTESALKKALPNERVELMNTAVSNLRIRETSNFMMKEGYKYSPDVVIDAVTIYDVISPPPKFTIKPGRGGARFPKASTAIQTYRDLRAAFAQYDAQRTQSSLEIRGEAKGRPPEAPFRLRWSDPVTYPDSPAVQQAWKDVYAQLDELVEDSKKHNYKVVLVIYPFSAQLHGNAAARGPGELFAKYATEHGVPVLDLLPILEAEGKKHAVPEDMFIDTDHMPKRETAALIGNAIAKFVVDNNLLAN